MLESLYLQNFKVFDKCKVDFGNGVAVVVGENGNGKSSLFEAIEFSLFGTIVRKGRKFGSTYAPITDLIQTNKPSARVELLFKSPVNKKTYRVVRSIDRNNRKDDALFLGDRLVSKGTTTVNSTISEILGLGFDAFSAISYVRQGEISELTRKTSGEREKVIDRILNLEIFEKARELANKDKAQYERDRDIIKTKQEELRTGLEADSGRLKEIRKSMSELGPAFKEKDKLYKKMKQEKAISDKIEKFETKESELKKGLARWRRRKPKRWEENLKSTKSRRIR